MARTFAIGGSFIGFATKERSHRMLMILNLYIDKALQARTAKDMRLEKDEEMFGDGDGKLNQKQPIVKLYQ